MYNHKCSCGQTYTDDDPEVYFCSTCVEQRKQIAEEVNKKLAGRVNNSVDKSFDALCNKFGRTVPSDRGGLATFFRASDLGI